MSGIDQRPSPPPASAPTRVERWLDTLAVPDPPVFGCVVPPYLAFGVAGIATGFALALGLALVTHLPVTFVLILLLDVLATFVIAALVRRAIVGREQHVLLQDVLAVLTTGGLVAWAVDQPILAALDLLAPALGAFLFFGRLGCQRAGCCHGRPARFGARHVGAGPLAGLRLFPLALVEAAWLVPVTAVSLLLVVAHATPGASLSFFLLAYGAGRFVFELARGDAARARLGPLSEAQWTVVALLLARVAYEAIEGELPRATLIGAGAAIAVVLLAWATRRLWLALPRAFPGEPEVAAWQRGLEDLERGVRAGSRGPRRLAGHEIELTVDPADDGLEVHAYAVRDVAGRLDAARAHDLAGILLQRLPAFALLRLELDGEGVLHVWASIDPRGRRGSSVGEAAFELRLRAQAFAHAWNTWVVPAAAPAAAPRPELLPPAPIAAAESPEPAEPGLHAVPSLPAFSFAVRPRSID